MKPAWIIAAALLSTAAHAANLHISDGDTFVLDGERIRIENIDAPELFSPSCESERRLAIKAKRELERLLGAGPIVLKRAGRKDKYSRTLAKVTVNGKDVGEAMIAAELARLWRGSREAWC
jgi:micrococcal nuclease